MKFRLLKYLLIILLAFPGMEAQAQVLDGVWKGYFTDGTDRQYLSIEFIYNVEKTYTVFSYTRLSAYEAKCRMTYSIVPPDSLYLHEVEMIQPKNKNNACLQSMNLKLYSSDDKKTLILKGTWYSDEKSCGTGAVYFDKPRRN